MNHQVRLTKTWMKAPFKGRNLPRVKGSIFLDFKGQCLICLNDGWKTMFLLKWSLFMRHVKSQGVVGLSTHFGASGKKSSAGLVGDVKAAAKKKRSATLFGCLGKKGSSSIFPEKKDSCFNLSNSIDSRNSKIKEFIFQCSNWYVPQKLGCPLKRDHVTRKCPFYKEESSSFKH